MRSWVACALGSVALAGPAQAHEPPKGVALVWPGPANAELPIVVTNRGLVYPGAQGAPFALRCNEAYGVPTSYVPFVSVDPSTGTLLLGTSDMVATSSDRACSFDVRLDLTASLSVLGGIVQWPEQPSSLLLSTVSSEGANQLWRSSDRGRSWTLASELPEKTYYTQLMLAPSEATRVYASVAKLDASASVVDLWARSSDGGESFSELPQPNERFPLAVHPLMADVVFASEWSDANATSARLLRSEDGAATFSSVLELPVVSAFAATPDGSVLWVGGGRGGGLHRSTDGGLSFERVLPELQDIDCLSYREGVLWLCANQLPNLDGIWTLEDGASVLENVLTFDQVTEQVACTGEAASVCTVPWFDWQSELMLPVDVPDAGAADAGAAPDPGSASDAGQGAAPRKDGGCSVAQVDAQRPPLTLWLVLGALLLWRRRLQFARLSPRPSRGEKGSSRFTDSRPA